MKYSSLEKAIYEKLSSSIVDVTPGVVVRAYSSGRMICDVAVGSTYPYYDLASLTKVFFTQQALMKAFDQNKWNLDSLVTDFLPDFLPEKKIMIKNLLTHTSGLDWWQPFYKDLNPAAQDQVNWQTQRVNLYRFLNKSESYKPIYIDEETKKKLRSDESATKAVYSDLGFLTLGFVLEKIEQKNLHEVWLETKRDFYPHSTVDFNLNNLPLFDRHLYAPTEECSYRKKVMRGEVHDENTWALGGVSSHAGLFGSIDDLAVMGLNLRSQLMGIAKYKVRQKTAQFFASRAIPVEIGDWALGYMMPSAENASCGPHFSIHSIGHTGFTGTSFWYDPRSDLLVLALSNRVNYGRDNRRYVSLRPQIHSWIFEAVKRAI